MSTWKNSPVCQVICAHFHNQLKGNLFEQPLQTFFKYGIWRTGENIFLDFCPVLWHLNKVQENMQGQLKETYKTHRSAKY